MCGASQSSFVLEQPFSVVSSVTVHLKLKLQCFQNEIFASVLHSTISLTVTLTRTNFQQRIQIIVLIFRYDISKSDLLIN